MQEIFGGLSPEDIAMVMATPVPPAGTASLHVWRIREFQDVASMADDVDIPNRFLAAAASGLAYQLGLKRLAKETGAKNENLRFLIQTLKGEYEQLLLNALESDRETATLRFEVDFGGYFD